MIPTQEIKYKPHVKRPLYDYNRESGANYYPGKYKNDVNSNEYNNKKMIENGLNFLKFKQKYENPKKSENEESKHDSSCYSEYSNNKNKNYINKHKGNKLYKGNKGKVCTYYFDNPIISCSSMKKSQQNNRSCDTTTAVC